MSDKGVLTMSEVKFWQQEAQSCEQRQRSELIQRNNYPFLINYFEGIESVDAQDPHVTSKQRMAIINEYFPSTNSLISEIMYQNPDILVNASKPDAEEDAPLMRSALEYLFDKSDGLVENRVGLFDMLYAGYCAVEVDMLHVDDRPQFDSEPIPTESTGKESIFDKFRKGVKSAMSSEEAERNLAKLAPPIEANFSTVQGTYIRRYDPLDVPLDWRAERVKDRRYNLKRVWMSKAEFDAKYPEFKDKVNVEDQKFSFSKHNLMMHNNKVMLHEFQVRLRGNKYQTIVVSPNFGNREIDAFIRPYTTNGFNMKIGTLHKYGKLYPKSFAQVNKTMNDELNNYTRHLMEVAERNVPKHVINKNKVKEDGMTALRSKNVNDIVEVDGNTSGAVSPLQPTIASFENKELMSIFQDQKNKLWAVSEARISGRAQNEFATDSAIQDAGFKARNVDIQEGLRTLITQQLDTGKDIIATFWDGEIFLKVAGSEKMDWYEPIPIPDPNDPSKSIISNPLAELLTADYNIKVDIASAGRKNRDQELQTMNFFMTQIVAMRQILIDQGKDINIDEIKRISKEFGWNPDKLFIDFNPGGQPNVPTAGGETISPDEDARREFEAQALAQGGEVV